MTWKNGRAVEIVAGTFKGKTARIVRLTGDPNPATAKVVKVEIDGDYFDLPRAFVR